MHIFFYFLLFMITWPTGAPLLLATTAKKPIASGIHSGKPGKQCQGEYDEPAQRV